MRPGTTSLITIRPARAEDRDVIGDMLGKTGAFRDEEIDVALELIDAYLHDTSQQDYDIYTGVDSDGTVAGYVCFGPAALTNGTFDLYWIAVNPDSHRGGAGTQLLRHVEELVQSRGARLLVAETSSQPSYEKARSFYRKNGYRELARITDYYTPGDDLVVFGKYFSQSGA
ncbi:MAG TPA: GNAT family N-acetyltransferase [Bacteroidota bacterium]